MSLSPFRTVLRVLLPAVVLLGVAAGGARAQAPAAPAAVIDPAPAWYREGLKTAAGDSAAAQEEGETRLAAARAAGDRFAEAYAHLLVALARGRQNDMPLLLGHTREALELAAVLGSPHLLLAARSRRASAFRAAGDPAASVSLYLETLPLAEQLGDRDAHREALDGLARAYSDLGDKDKAVELGRRAVAAAEQSENPAAIAASLTVLSAAHRGRGEFAETRRILERVLALRRPAGPSIELTDTEESLAMLDFRDGRLVEALAVLDRVEGLRRSLRGRAKLTNTLVNRARVLTALGRHDAALAAIEEARGYADSIESPAVVALVYGRLSSVQEARGDHAAALAAYQRAVVAESAVRGESARRKTAELQVRYDVAKKDEELARLARITEVKAAEERARSAQLALTAVELRAAESDLARVRFQRLALGSMIVAASVLFGAVVLSQRARLRAEQRALEETRRAQLLAEDAGVLKARLLAVASHDLKGPLRAVLRSADALEHAAADPAAVAATARQLRGQAQGMSDLVRDLLDLGAIESGGVQLRKTEFDLGPLVAGVVARHAARAAEKQQSLALAPAEGPGLLFHGDAARLAQAIDNLVDNAVKYSPVGGAVRVAVARREPHLCITVADTGAGLAAADLARIFQPFQRLSAEPTAGESSTGLGLHITREFVAQHGGTVEVDTVPGRGSTFTVLLPAGSAARAAV